MCSQFNYVYYTVFSNCTLYQFTGLAWHDVHRMHISAASLAEAHSRMQAVIFWQNSVSGRPLQVTVCPMLHEHCSVCLSVGNVYVLWPNGSMYQDAAWYGGRPRPRQHCVRWGPSSPHGDGQSSPLPLFGPCLLWPNGRASQQLLSSCNYSNNSRSLVGANCYWSRALAEGN